MHKRIHRLVPCLTVAIFILSFTLQAMVEFRKEKEALTFEVDSMEFREQNGTTEDDDEQPTQKYIEPIKSLLILTAHSIIKLIHKPLEKVFIPELKELLAYILNKKLHSAIWDQDKDLTLALLDQGSDVNSKDKFEQTALMCAAQRGIYKVAQMLLERGALVNLQDTCGRTALMHAASVCDYSMVNVLLRNKALPDLKDKYNKTARESISFIQGQIAHRRIASLLNKYECAYSLLLLTT